MPLVLNYVSLAMFLMLVDQYFCKRKCKCLANQRLGTTGQNFGGMQHGMVWTDNFSLDHMGSAPFIIVGGDSRSFASPALKQEPPTTPSPATTPSGSECFSFGFIVWILCYIELKLRCGFANNREFCIFTYISYISAHDYI